MKKPRIIAGIVMMLLAGIVLSSCGGKQETIKIGEVTRSVFYAPEYVALAEGFFKDEGLKVELQTTPGGDKTMTALLSNQINVALVGAETSIYVYQQGAEDPVINFAGLTQTDGTFLVARAANNSFDWNQLKGSDFLGQRKGGMPQVAGEFTLKKQGIDPQQDLNLIQNIDFANITAAFASGTGQYVQLFEPQASIMEKEGKGHVVASFGTESGKLQYTVFMAKQSFIKGHQDSIKKFTAALYKVQQWVDQHSPEEIAKTIAPYFNNTDMDIITSSVKRYKEQGTYAKTPAITEEMWNNLQNVMDSAGELKSKVEMSKIVDPSFATEATK